MWRSDVVVVVLANWGMLLAFAIMLWLVCMLRRDVSIIDRYWGPMCAAPGVLTLVQLGSYTPYALLLVCLSSIWALRLAYHITRRNWKTGQDFRYSEAESPIFTRSSSPLATLVFVFLGQASLAWFISAPIQLGQFDTVGLEISALSWVGVGVWTVGFLFEAVGDWQLRRFKANPQNRGRILEQGLWAWTRHPNYFGDSTVWFGLYLIAAGTPLGIYGALGPLLLLFLLVRVTGKDLTEKLMLAKHPAYSDYVRRTSGFFPLPPGSS
jgi:steroid 5-alpha reductase family enzyme